MMLNIQELISHTKFFLTSDLSVVSHDTLKIYMREVGQLISKHNTLYYTAEPIISDKEYDELFQILSVREEKYPDFICPNSPTQKMNIQVQDIFQKKEHGEHRLLSLKNSYVAADLRDRDVFLQRQLPDGQQYTYIVEPKFDGSSIQLVYEYGHFVAGITRGDGRVGEDVTQHIKLVHNLPLYIEAMKDVAVVRLRGEVMMTKTAFAYVNNEQIKKGLAPFANERNAASGTLRQLDPNMVRKRGLVVYILDIIYRSYAQDIQTDIQRKELLASRGLPFFPRSKTCSSIDEVISLCLDVGVKEELYRNNLLFDGLVIKLNTIALRDMLGATDHHPRRAMAYKYPAQQTTTTLKHIQYQLGRTGVVTPVAELEPVELSGAVISRATLHNFDMIKKLDIRIGDAVWLQRSGEVIPYIIGPVVQRRTGSEKKVVVPVDCPSCGTLLQRKEGEVAWICTNKTSCRAQQIEQLKHAVSKHGMNISGLGNAVVQQFVEVGLLSNWSDIFALTEKQHIITLRSLPGIAEKKIQQLTNEIQGAKHMELWRRLHAIGIPFVGKKVARMLSSYVDSYGQSIIDKQVLKKDFLNKEALKNVFGIGQQTIDALYDYFSDSTIFNQLAFAEQYGFTLYIEKEKTTLHKVLTGEVIVLTGSFKISRDVLTDLFSQLGARVTTSVTDSTTRVVYGDKAGSKLIKAGTLGIATATLEEFIKEYTIVLPKKIVRDVSGKQSTVVSLF